MRVSKGLMSFTWHCEAKISVGMKMASVLESEAHHQLMFEIP
jgi:hypothetical protein